MTRINCVPVECLTKSHLMAEYKESTRPFNKVTKRLDKNTMVKVKIPEKYCLGKGHETFFFDKLMWLLDRRQDIFDELIKRGFNLNVKQFMEIQTDLHDKFFKTKYGGYWEPSPEDMYLNMSRLVKRSNIVEVTEELSC